MIHDLNRAILAKLETSLRWLVGGELPLDASGTVLPEAWEAIANRLRSEGWEGDAQADGVQVAGTIRVSFAPPDKIRITETKPLGNRGPRTFRGIRKTVYRNA